MSTHGRLPTYPAKNRSHEIITSIDLDGSEEGVIVAVGGMTGGFSMYIKNYKLHYDYNSLDGVHYHLTSKRLPKGEYEGSPYPFNGALDRVTINLTDS